MKMDSPDMAEIVQAVGRIQGGDPTGGRAALLALWKRLGVGGTSMQRCVIAHFLADSEQDVAAALEWDLRALQAATGSREAVDADAIDPELAGFLPSLHLNAGDAWRQMGDLDRARLHAAHGRARSHALPVGGYGDLIRGGLARLADRVASAAGDPPDAKSHAAS